MEYTSGLPLSLVSPNIWKGQNKSNGQLELIHNFHLKVSYSSLAISTALQAELTTAVENGVPFGNALWYDRYIKTTYPNKVYAGIPTAANAIPQLAGILCYDAAIGGLQPAANKGVMPHNKGTMVKAGFMRYKTAKVAVGGAAIAFSAIDDVTMCLFFENSTGDPIIAAPTAYGLKLPTFTATTVAEVVTALSGKDVLIDSKPVPYLLNATYGGKIIKFDPEDQSILVQLDF